MKFPQAITLIVALVLAVATYFLSESVFTLTQTSVAITVFITAILTTLVDNSLVKNQEGADEVKTLYVGNLPYRANEAAIRELFSEYCQVKSVRLMKDKHTGKRRGFGFVEISAADLDKTISALNDSEFQQRTLKVREAKDRPEKSVTE